MPEPVSFARDVLPLFRELDLEMPHAFDLSDHADVCAWAEAIHERLADGSMPCDAPWPDEDVALFRRWIDEGRHP
ncbi:hypothetical protein ACIBXA_29740 [Micromonospora echinaurantiaca]|uniref:hypothetical protein n=1 Tax=Micromonospora TaxID=1873 RepID=UPI000D6F1269|nr:hypothetical protein [Micromonospora sp. S4605]PWU50584.1 hypothetical protein DLJ47_23765 [Micromonospora sp. S4605]